MDSIQEMLIEKYLFTKAPPGPYHKDEWLCLSCKTKLEGKYDFYPSCISCYEDRHKKLHACYYYREDEHEECESITKFKEWVVNKKKEMQ